MRPAGDRQARAVDVPALDQRADDDGGAADVVDILGGIFAARAQIADQRRAREHLADIVEREGDAGLVGDRRHMQRGVGRAAGRGDDGRAVFQRLSRDDFARQRAAAFQHLHHQSPGLARDLRALGIDAGDHRHVGHRQPHRLRHHRHGVGGELAGAGADRRQAGPLDAVERRLVDLAGHEAADRLVGIQHGEGLALEPAGQRAAAIDEDRRHVAADHAHHHAGQRLVAAAEADQGVVGKAVDHGLDRIGNQFARQQRELHALVVHADAVGDRNGGEFARRAAGLRDPVLGGVDLEIVGHVAGRLLALHADHADHRLGDRRIVEPHRAHEGAVRRTIEAIGRHAGSPLLHAAISPRSSRPNAGDARSGRLADVSAYCSGATIVGCLNCATSIFGSIPVSA